MCNENNEKSWQIIRVLYWNVASQMYYKISLTLEVLYKPNETHQVQHSLN